MVECGELVRNKEKMTFRFRRLGCCRSIGIYMDDRPFSRWCPLVLLGGVKEGRKEGREWVNSVSKCRCVDGQWKVVLPTANVHWWTLRFECVSEKRGRKRAKVCVWFSRGRHRVD